MRVIIFDVETTGLPLHGVDIADPRQPRIVQLAAQLSNEVGEVISSLSSIIKPDGWTSIPEGAQKAHGISFERCMDEGRDMKDVLAEFNAMKDEATDRAAYNISFDKRLLLREATYHEIEHDNSKFDNNSYCVMKMVTPIVKMPPTGKMVKAGFDKFKNPKLIEAYKFFFDKEFEGAHDALNDVIATREILFHVRKNYPDSFKPEVKKEWIPTPPRPETVKESEGAF